MKDLVKKCVDNLDKFIQMVFDLVEMEDDERREFLQMSDVQLMEIVRVCNCFLNIDFVYEVLDNDDIFLGDIVMFQVIFEREMEGR